MRKRILSALVLAPAALAAAYLGAPYWDQVIVVLGLLMGWEWARLCGGGTLSPAGVGLIAGVLTVLLVAELWGFKPALLALVLAGPAVAGIAAPQFRGRAAWFAAGMLYVGLSCLALIWIRADVEHGLVILLWVLALVWATDTAAYFTGKAIGGPKLAPRISPNKTWAGLAGGMLAATGVGVAFAIATPILSPWFFVMISGSLAVVEQIGDLFESAVKRRFGVKDSGALIPGHGGVLDRVDGLIAVAMAVAVLTLASGRSPLLW